MDLSPVGVGAVEVDNLNNLDLIPYVENGVRQTTAPRPVSGVCRKGKRTKDLIRRLKPGDVAVIDHVDLDALAALSLIDAGVCAVIDAAVPISGRYPNRGPSILGAARIPLYQLCSQSDFELLHDGKSLTLDLEARVLQGGRAVCQYKIWTPIEVEQAVEAARSNLGRELEVFAANTLEHVREETGLLLDEVSLPDLHKVRSMRGRHVVIVVRGEGYREDLQSIAGYLQDIKPILIGVDGGADALLEHGFTPDIILGDMDSVSDDALRLVKCLVVHAYPKTCRAPGMDRLKALGLGAQTMPVAGTSEDAAMLLAYQNGAKIIVAVGTHSNLEDFLDKGRAGMASTFLVRLKVGSRLVDARGVSVLHQRRVSGGELGALLLSGALVVLVVLSQTTLGHWMYEMMRLVWREVFR